MQNSYLVDIFLTFWAWLVLFFLYVDTKKLKNKACEHINQHLLVCSIHKYAKPSLAISLCFMSAFSFLLWRFAVVLIEFKAFDNGAIGLLVIMWVIAFVLSWIKSILNFAIHNMGAGTQLTRTGNTKHHNFFTNNEISQ